MPLHFLYLLLNLNAVIHFINSILILLHLLISLCLQLNVQPLGQGHQVYLFHSETIEELIQALDCSHDLSLEFAIVNDNVRVWQHPHLTARVPGETLNKVNFQVE